jgi:hypothetical protein
MDVSRLLAAIDSRPLPNPLHAFPDAEATLGVALRALVDSGDNATVRIAKRMTPAGWLFEVEFHHGAEPP